MTHRENVEGQLTELIALPGQGSGLSQVKGEEVMARGFLEMFTIYDLREGTDKMEGSEKEHMKGGRERSLALRSEN